MSTMQARGTGMGALARAHTHAHKEREREQVKRRGVTGKGKQETHVEHELLKEKKRKKRKVEKVGKNLCGAPALSPPTGTGSDSSRPECG